MPFSCVLSTCMVRECKAFHPFEGCSVMVYGVELVIQYPLLLSGYSVIIPVSTRRYFRCAEQLHPCSGCAVCYGFEANIALLVRSLK
jgi:hypothetical protein